ncbi:MAG: hypothetical protein KIT02_10315 [Devosia sp.]|uniref:hypothetical protein n=1 Tax=Devosia sp. TaxID=1871048 RepID=UPI0024C8FF87|nr:hypothetical protein [Devosia sp.]UYN98360.1 MAG: hypothetical protein KIT02_10315 [Devosia sp.]
MRRIVALTDVLAHENRFPKGTGFKVVDGPDPKARPPEVGPSQADAWERQGWAEPAKGAGKAVRGDDAGGE